MDIKSDFRLLVYNSDSCDVFTGKTFDNIKDKIDKNKNNWLDVRNIEIHIDELSQYFKIHNLLKEDILSKSHLPKTEEHSDFLFVGLKDIEYKKKQVNLKDLNFLLNENILCSFHGKKNDNFDTIIERISSNKGIVRKQNTGYLLYLLLDVIIDSYLPIIEQFREKIDKLELFMLKNKQENKIDEILALKRQFIRFRKFVFPLIEVISKTKRYNVEIFDMKEFIYYNDLEDHIKHVQTSMDIFRDIFMSLIDLNKSNQDEQTNSVMKILTVVTTIFIPLSFIAGLYGMNFKYMPELSFKYSYPIVLLVMFLLVVIMFIFMKKKKWF